MKTVSSTQKKKKKKKKISFTNVERRLQLMKCLSWPPTKLKNTTLLTNQCKVYTPLQQFGNHTLSNAGQVKENPATASLMKCVKMLKKTLISKHPMGYNIQQRTMWNAKYLTGTGPSNRQ